LQFATSRPAAGGRLDWVAEAGRSAYNLGMIAEIREAQAQLAELCRRHNVRRLEIFGSAVGLTFNSHTSDLDFIVEFGAFAVGGYAEHYFDLLDDLKRLFGRPIDLVILRAVSNPYLLESINRSRELLYAA
jgi:uncharacterized protein